jgi:hypothetical protein
MSVTQTHTTTQSLPFIEWLESHATPAEFAELEQANNKAVDLMGQYAQDGKVSVTQDSQSVTQQWQSPQVQDQFQAARGQIPGIQQLDQYLAQYWQQV